MPVLLTTPAGDSMTAASDEALKLQRRFRTTRLRSSRVASGKIQQVPRRDRPGRYGLPLRECDPAKDTRLRRLRGQSLISIDSRALGHRELLTGLCGPTSKSTVSQKNKLRSYGPRLPNLLMSCLVANTWRLTGLRQARARSRDERDAVEKC